MRRLIALQAACKLHLHRAGFVSELPFVAAQALTNEDHGATWRLDDAAYRLPRPPDFADYGSILLDDADHPGPVQWVEVEVGVAPHTSAEPGFGSGPGGALIVDHFLDRYPLHVNTSTQQHLNRYI